MAKSEQVTRRQVRQRIEDFPSLIAQFAYLLIKMHNPVNQERFEWLATAIRSFKGEASILQIPAIDDLPPRTLKQQFRQARAADYEALIEEAKKLKPAVKGGSAQIPRLWRRYEEIVAMMPISKTTSSVAPRAT